MLKTLFYRIIVSIPLIVLVSGITFVLQSMVPGDAARSIVGEEASEEVYEKVRTELRLDDPLLARWGNYLSDMVQGDLGLSLFSSMPVTTLIGQRLPVSLTLMIGATLLAVVFGVLLGVLSSTKGKGLSKVVDAISMVGFATPNFWLGLILVAAFAIAIPIFPATGYREFGTDPAIWIMFLILPFLALAVNGIALIAKAVRDAMLTNLNMPYIQTLRAAGVAKRSLIWKHALRNSGVSAVTVMGLVMVSSLAGTVFVENVFALPGLGSLAVSAINGHDMPVTQGVVLTYTILIIIVNLLVDFLYTLINPKVRV